MPCFYLSASLNEGIVVGRQGVVMVASCGAHFVAPAAGERVKTDAAMRGFACLARQND